VGGGVAALVALIALEAGWLAFDGAHAILTGDYVTPSTGPHAGQLGPWAALARAIGVDPRSTGMNAFFLAYGGYGWWQARRWRHDCPGGRAS